MNSILGRRRACLAAAGLVLVTLASAEAATCTEEIALLAQQYGLSGAPRAEAPAGSTDRAKPPRATPLSEAKRARMEALLNAAKAAEQQRQPGQCFAHLSEARAIPEPG